MTKKEIYYDSRDNQTKIHAVVWTPDTEPKAIVILVHGMAEHIERYDEFAQFLCEKGYVVAGNDHLGHGNVQIITVCWTCPIFRNECEISVCRRCYLNNFTEQLSLFDFFFDPLPFTTCHN